jgi:hypothetical protein
MNAPALGTEPDRLLHRRPLAIAGAGSLPAVIVALPFVVLLALLVGGAGLALAAGAHDRAAARRAGMVTSVGFGLTVGPFVYILLALIAVS